MWPDYQDVISRIVEPPTWWDSSGYPRWDEPKDGATNIYVDEGIVVRIGCQGCDKTFLVVYEESHYEPLLREDHRGLITMAKDGDPPHYGDPPRHGCVGDTMNSYAISTVRTWKRGPVDKGLHYEYETVDWDGSPDWMKPDEA